MEKALAPHSSTLTWKIPWTEPSRLQTMGLLRVGHDWATSLSCIGEGNGNPLQCSCLENPRDGRAWWAAVYGMAQSWTRLKWLSSSSWSAFCLEHLIYLHLLTYMWYVFSYYHFVLDFFAGAFFFFPSFVLLWFDDYLLVLCSGCFFYVLSNVVFWFAVPIRIYFFKWGVVVLVSAVQHSEPPVCVHVSHPSQATLPAHSTPPI